MKIIGIDPSSTSSGVSLVEVPYDHSQPKIIWTKVWQKDKSKSAPENLWLYFSWLCSEGLVEHIGSDWNRPVAEMACVEFLSVSRNSQTTRMISHYQAASVLACKRLGMVVVEARVSSARKEALGKAGSKDDAWEAVKKMFPDHKFRRRTSGGDDETDAVVLGLAARGLAER